MPYDAAKAVAATFCWGIRYALTPVFGIDFPKMCIPPESDKFGEMLIDPEITKKCTEQARLYCEMELEGRDSRASSEMPSPLTPGTPAYPRHIKQLHPKAFKVAPSSSSGYATDTSRDDNYAFSPITPQSTYRNEWTAANTPRSVPMFDTTPPPRDLFRGYTMKHSTKKSERSNSPSEQSSPAVSPKTRPADVEEAPASDSLHGPGHVCSLRHHEGRKQSARLPSDEKAAYLLMSLKLQKASLESKANGRKRRASALV